MRLLMTAFVFGIPETKMRCIALHVGGGFGTKIFLYHEYVLMAALAEKVGRPVKWVETRRENYVATTHGRDHVAHLEVGANRDGTITALKAKTYANLGGVLSTIAPGIPTTLYGRMLSGAYRTRTSTARCWASTPTPAWSTPTAAPGGPRRRTSSSGPSTCGPGTRPRSGRRAPQELHPTRRVPLRPGHPQGAEVRHRRLREGLDRALEIVGYEDFRREQEEAAARRYRGIGFSTVEICGAAPPPGSEPSARRGASMWERQHARST